MPRIYKGRTPEEQRAYNAERRKRLKEAREQQAQGIDTSKEMEDFTVNIEAEDVKRPELSFKDRLLSRFQKDDDEEKKPPTKAEKEHVEKSEKLLSHILPVTISTLLAMYSQNLFSEEYKACAPTKEEVSLIITPYFSILSRHVGVEGRATQDAIDIMSSILASITMGTRMLMTAEKIRKGQNEAGNTSDNISQFRGGAKSGSIQTGPSTLRSDKSANGTEQYRGESNASANGHGDVGDDLTTDGPSDADKVARLMRRDTLGRRQMGLAPRNLREED